ncbi:MAG: hypothetical protein HKO91_07540 [Desulfobacterales bacterium]|nr:hypothetical protein [Desulfobacterales bacterium]
MKKVIFWLILVGGSIAVYQMAEGYWVVGWIGICLAIGYVYHKLPTFDATLFVGFFLVYFTILFGGMIFIARNWGETPAMIFIIIWAILLMVFGKKVMRIIPIFHMVETFEENVKRQSSKD